MKCPKCGHTFKATNQIKGGKARWSGMSKAKRKQAASAAAKARWARTPNDRAKPSRTDDVARDSGTDSDNGCWLRRLVRHQR